MMKVETYEQLEADDETGEVEKDEEAIALIEKLDLAGQRELVTPDGQTERCPYRLMTADEQFTYGVLCPQHVGVREYSASSIPLRVLQVASHALDTTIFEKVEVWHAATGVVADPVLVGIRSSGYPPPRFILARWGTELRNFKDLLSDATTTFRQQVVGACRSAKGRAESDLAQAEHMTDANLIEHFNRNWHRRVPEYEGLR